MAFRALLFSNDQETNLGLTAACQSAGIRLEVSSDIFSAIEKGTKQPFSCVLVDWSEMPEAGFLLKRARESAQNVNAVAIAIVSHEPTAAEMRDHRLQFLIYRPIVASEAQQVLAKASEQMQAVSAGKMGEVAKLATPPHDKPAAMVPAPPESESGFSSGNESTVHHDASLLDGAGDSEENLQEIVPAAAHRFPLKTACAVALALGAACSVWIARDTVAYLTRTPENKIAVFKDAVAALFYLSPTSATSVGAVSTDSQQDAYFSRGAANPNAKPQLAVVSSEADINISRFQMRTPYDFPLPAPVFDHPEPAPVETRHATIPDSLRGSAPITRPVVVSAVTPAQMMPVSAPAVPPVSQTQFTEPVTLSEEAQRALLIHSVNPRIPPKPRHKRSAARSFYRPRLDATAASKT